GFALLTVHAGTISVPAMTGSAFTTGWRRAAIVAVVAYALVLQALAFSFAGALHTADGAELPHAVLCAPGGGQAAPESAPGQAHDGRCCTLACHGPALSNGPAPASVAFERPF